MAKKEVEKKNEVKIENVSVKVMAISKGQHKGKIRRIGEKFLYAGITKDGKLPSWVEALEKVKVEKESKNLNDLV